LVQSMMVADTNTRSKLLHFAINLKRRGGSNLSVVGLPTPIAEHLLAREMAIWAPLAANGLTDARRVSLANRVFQTSDRAFESLIRMKFYVETYHIDSNVPYIAILADVAFGRVQTNQQHYEVFEDNMIDAGRRSQHGHTHLIASSTEGQLHAIFYDMHHKWKGSPDWNADWQIPPDAYRPEVAPLFALNTPKNANAGSKWGGILALLASSAAAIAYDVKSFNDPNVGYTRADAAPTTFDCLPTYYRNSDGREPGPAEYERMVRVVGCGVVLTGLVARFTQGAKTPDTTVAPFMGASYGRRGHYMVRALQAALNTFELRELYDNVIGPLTALAGYADAERVGFLREWATSKLQQLYAPGGVGDVLDRADRRGRDDDLEQRPARRQRRGRGPAGVDVLYEGDTPIYIGGLDANDKPHGFGVCLVGGPVFGAQWEGGKLAL
jgi:hypothetical protein